MGYISINRSARLRTSVLGVGWIFIQRHTGGDTGDEA
nr:MAG TPA: hypothetical protein [Caudoviricetes sp.]